MPINRKNLKVSGYRDMISIHTSKTGEYSRAAIWGKKGEKLAPLNKFNSKDFVSAIWDLSTYDPNTNETIKADRRVLVSVYADGHQDIATTLEALKKVIDFAKQRKYPCIIHGDFNAHSQLWGSKREDDRGKEMAYFINNNELMVHNSHVPTRRNNISQTNIDVTLTNLAGNPLIKSWKRTFTDTSDHAKIYIGLYEEALEHKTWLKRSTNWDEYTKILGETGIITPEEWTAQDIERVAEMITNNIVKVWKANTRMTKIGKPKIPFWDAELEEAKILKHRKVEEFYRNPTEENRIIRQKASRDYEKLQDKKRKAAEHDYMDGLKSPTDLANLTRVRQDRIHMGLFHMEDGETVEYEKTSAHLLDVHCPDSHPAPLRTPPTKLTQTKMIRSIL